jgi:hypothetical protein
MNRFSIAAIAALLVVPCIALSQGAAAKSPQGGGRVMMGGQGGFDMKRMKEMRAKRQKEIRDQLVKELKLTPDQIKKYDALTQKENAERDKMMASMTGGMRPGSSAGSKPPTAGTKPPSGGTKTGPAAGPAGARGGMMANFQKMREKHDAEMKKILNATQFAKYQKIVQEMRSRMRMGGPGGSAGRPGAAGGSSKGGS